MSNSLMQTPTSHFKLPTLNKHSPSSSRWVYYSFLIINCLLISSCHRIVPTKSAMVAPARPVEPTVQAKNTTFRYLKAKGKLQVNLRGNKQTANMSLRIRRDSAIWLSGSLVGIEGVRALLTSDSVRVVMPLQREYFVGGYDYLSKTLGVAITFQQIQALLLGDYFPAPTGTAPTVVNEQSQQRVSYPQTTLLLQQLISLGSGRLQQLKVTDSSLPRALTVDYSDFRPIDPNNLPFAHATFVQAQQDKGDNTTLNINYQKVDIDRERLHFPFAVPVKYKRIKK